MRSHIEFIQAQLLPWRWIGQEAAGPGAEYKFLSCDEETGVCSVLIRLPEKKSFCAIRFEWSPVAGRLLKAIGKQIHDQRIDTEPTMAGGDTNVLSLAARFLKRSAPGDDTV